MRHLTPLEAAVAGLAEGPPAARLEAIWLGFEEATGKPLGRPPSPAERSEVAEWLRFRRADNDGDSFIVYARRLRSLAHRTLAEKAGYLVQARCPACEIVVDAEGRITKDVVTAIPIEPWTAQSTKNKVAIREAVTKAMRDRNLLGPIADEPLCVTVVSFVPRTRGRMDADNLAKGLLDALQGVLYINDWQIQCVTARRLIAQATEGAYLLSARVVHPYEADVVHDDGSPLNILFPRIEVL